MSLSENDWQDGEKNKLGKMEKKQAWQDREKGLKSKASSATQLYSEV